MKKFKFRLQPILKLRAQQEDQKKRVVGSLMGQIAEQQRQALELSESLKEQGCVLKGQFELGRVDTDWISHYQSFVASTHNAIARRIDNVTQIQTKLTGARIELAEAAKQTKIMEKLKEKQKRNYDAQLKRQEMLELDEIGTTRYVFNGGFGGAIQ